LSVAVLDEEVFPTCKGFFFVGFGVGVGVGDGVGFGFGFGFGVGFGFFTFESLVGFGFESLVGFGFESLVGFGFESLVGFGFFFARPAARRARSDFFASAVMGFFDLGFLVFKEVGVSGILL